MRLAAALLLALAIFGCSGGINGTYSASVEPLGEKKTTDPYYSTEEVAKRLAANPRKLHLEGPKFRTSEGDRTIWEGSWRKEGDKLFLRATRVQGTEVNEKLQQDYELKVLPDGRFADDHIYGGYGLRVIFKKD